MESDQREQGTELVKWLAQYAVGMLQDEAATYPDPQELLSAANDWVAMAFEERLARKSKKTDLCSMVQASILATHTYLIQQAGGQGLLYTFGYSSKNSSVVVHTPESLLGLYGKAVRGELPSPLLPLWQATSGLLVSTIRSSRILGTVLFLPREPVYPGTCKQYSIRKVLYSTILAEVSKGGNAREEGAR